MARANGAYSSRGQGVHGSGSKTYSPQDAQRLTDVLKRMGPTTVEDLADLLNMGGRAVRQILSDLDGVAFLLGGDDDGVLSCEWADEGDHKTRRLASQIKNMQERVERRERYAAAFLNRRQHSLL
jgi:hypothetical protein